MTGPFASSRARHRTVRLRVLLVLAITGLVLSGVIGATLLHVRSFVSHARLEAARTLDAAAAAVDAEAEALLRPAMMIVNHIRRTPADVIAQREDRLDRFLDDVAFVSAMESHVDAVFLGFPDGSSAFYGRNTEALRDLASLPDMAIASPFLRLAHDESVAPTVDRWHWRMDGAWTEVTRPHFGFDPRRRPWYLMASDARAPIWTPLYRSAKDVSYDMTLAVALRGGDDRPAAVLGVDIRLDDLVDFVNRLDVSANGIAFVAKSNGELLAHPALEMSRLVEAPQTDELTLFSIARDTRQDLRLFEAFGDGDRRRVEFEYEGEAYIGRRIRLNRFLGLDADLYVGAPLTDFTAAADRALWSALTLTGAVAVVVLLAGALISRAITRPIDRAVHAMQAISHLDELRPGQAERSVLSEIDSLNGAVELMRTALQSFSRYVPVEIVRDLIDQRDPLALGGRRREITVLFTDIEGFTQLTETEQHETMIAALGDYFDIMCGAIADHGGTVDKFIGDSVMAFWGAPSDDVNQSANACDAVADAMERLVAFNADRAAAGQPPLKTRFALHRGYAFVGNIGARDRFGYTALGDVVNTTARIESAAKEMGATVLASRAVVNHAGDQHRFAPRGQIELRGKHAAVEVFELASEQNGESNAISIAS